MSIGANIEKIKAEIGDGVVLVAVSKYSPDSDVQEAYDAGHRDFGENKAQELAARKEKFPKDVRWHFIGHMQTNKVKYIASFVYLIHSVDSMKLLVEINRQAAKHQRIIPCLLQVHIAQEETKFGLDENELTELLTDPVLKELKNIKVNGLMGMATNTAEVTLVEKEFGKLKTLYTRVQSMQNLPANVEPEILSMGMSADYKVALGTGSNMVRIGSAVFSH